MIKKLGWGLLLAFHREIQHEWFGCFLGFFKWAQMLLFTGCQKWLVSASCTIDHCDKPESLLFLSTRMNKHWDFVHLLNPLYGLSQGR